MKYERAISICDNFIKIYTDSMCETLIKIEEACYNENFSKEERNKEIIRKQENLMGMI